MKKSSVGSNLNPTFKITKCLRFFFSFGRYNAIAIGNWYNVRLLYFYAK